MTMRIVMTKRLKELAAETTESQLAELAVKIRDSANQIWLAGLGAFSKAQEGIVTALWACGVLGGRVAQRG